MAMSRKQIADPAYGQRRENERLAREAKYLATREETRTGSGKRKKAPSGASTPQAIAERRVAATASKHLVPKGLSAAEQNYIQEIEKCRDNFWYFCERYLSIITKDWKLGPVPLEARLYQRETIGMLMSNRAIFVLKARQLGISTIIAAYFFWLTLFSPNRVHAVIAHDLISANTIFNIYMGFYKRLPVWLRMPLRRSNVRELVFEHGGTIRVASADSENAAGSTLNSVHFSEFDRYKQFDTLLGSVMGALTPDAEQVYETTIEGNGNGKGFEVWDTDNGIGKLFFPWTVEPDYVLLEKPSKLDARIVQLGLDYNLPQERVNWASETLRLKYNSDIVAFHRAFPTTARLAFSVAGDRYFKTYFDDKDARLYAGRVVFHEPQPYHIYTQGVDTGAGSATGDWSSYVITDVTDQTRPVIACTNYMRLLPGQFAGIALADARKYNAFSVVERNANGISVIEHFLTEAYGQMYRTMAFDKAENRMTERLGWYTGGGTRQILLDLLTKFIDSEILEILDRRLRKEINTFGWNEDKGKWEAKHPNHDDMLIALALSLAGMAEWQQIAAVAGENRPVTFEQHQQFFAAKKRKVGPEDRFTDDPAHLQHERAEEPLQDLDAMYRDGGY